MTPYLGQSLLVEGKPAIYIGKGPNSDDFLFLTPAIDPKGHITVTVDELLMARKVSIVRQNNETSPSGKSWYYGSLCKYTHGDFKMKTPPDEDVKKEFKTIEKLSKQ